MLGGEIFYPKIESTAFPLVFGFLATSTPFISFSLKETPCIPPRLRKVFQSSSTIGV